MVLGRLSLAARGLRVNMTGVEKMLTLPRKWKASLVARTKPLRIAAAYRLLGRKLDRNQWQNLSPEHAATREAIAALDWDGLARCFPDYFARLSASVKHVRGHVLELGCGNGNMTRWIAAQPQVSGVVAVDGFEQAINRLSAAGLSGVKARCQPIDDLKFAPGERFDTLVLCEVLEHLYPDEERAMLSAVTPQLAEGACYILSAPVGWLDDPHHVRAFSERGLLRHARRWYGPVEGRDLSSGYSQVVWGRITRA
jgi:2-polyprenyl-3-methyl-5-hydroxy-6-metoxy-1,4-benzoquinol methylase